MTNANANGFKQGLTSTQVQALQVQYGNNELTPQKKESFFRKVLHIVSEPMFLLLAAAVINIILREPRDGAIMLANFATFVCLALILYSPLNHFLKLAPLTGAQLLTVLYAACTSVLWHEVALLVKKPRRKSV